MKRLLLILLALTPLAQAQDPCSYLWRSLQR